MTKITKKLKVASLGKRRPKVRSIGKLVSKLGFSNFSKDFLIRSGATKPIGKRFGSPRTSPEKGKGEEYEVRGTTFLRVRNRVFCAKFVISSREESLRVKDRIKFLIHYAIGCETHCTLLVCDSYLEKLIV